METIQELIQSEAEEQLSKEIKEFAEELDNNKFWKSLSNVGYVLPGRTVRENSALSQSLNPYYPNDGLFKVIFDNFIERYVSRKSKEFYDNVKNSQQKP